MPHKKLVKDIVRRYRPQSVRRLRSKKEKSKKKKNSLEAIRDSYFFVLLFLIHIIVRLSPLILFLSMALGMLPAMFMDIQNSVVHRPRGDFVLCKCAAAGCRCVLIIVTDVSAFYLTTDSR